MSYTEIPASIGQRLMWFLAHYRAETASVNCPAGFRIRGPLDPGKLAGTVDILMRRHESLRTTLHRRGRDLVQRVHEPGPTRVEWTELPAGAEAEVQRQYADELRAPIAVEQAPVRWRAWRIGADDHVLCANMHHLVSDAWSCGVLINDVIALLGDGAPPAPVGWQYRQFSAWQHEQSASGQLRADHDYWAAKLDGMRARPARAAPGQGAPRPGAARVRRRGRGGAARVRQGRADHAVPGDAGPLPAAAHRDRRRRSGGGLAVRQPHPAGGAADRRLLRQHARAAHPAGRRRLVPRPARRDPPYRPGRRRAPGRALPDGAGAGAARGRRPGQRRGLPDAAGPAPDSWSPTAVRNGLEIDTFRPSQG
ncbi:condensation domain-containing protein [Micromonospora sp. BRA006-A]|nr:condensation domain-containing protein [Micromonospora sp. BRA006-A]